MFIVLVFTVTESDVIVHVGFELADLFFKQRKIFQGVVKLLCCVFVKFDCFSIPSIFKFGGGFFLFQFNFLFDFIKFGSLPLFLLIVLITYWGLRPCLLRLYNSFVLNLYRFDFFFYYGLVFWNEVFDILNDFIKFITLIFQVSLCLLVFFLSLGSNFLSFCYIGFVLLGLSQKFPLLLFQFLDLRLNRIFFWEWLSSISFRRIIQIKLGIVWVFLIEPILVGSVFAADLFNQLLRLSTFCFLSRLL
jgi:hypothetical protein